jgi:hypothetical protein
MTYSFIPEGDAWAYSTNCCHVLANNKLYTINYRRKKARYIIAGFFTTLSSKLGAGNDLLFYPRRGRMGISDKLLSCFGQ